MRERAKKEEMKNGPRIPQVAPKNRLSEIMGDSSPQPKQIVCDIEKEINYYFGMKVDDFQQTYIDYPQVFYDINKHKLPILRVITQL